MQNYSYIEKLEELIPQLKIFAETFSVYFLQRYPSGTFYMFTLIFLLMMNSKIQKAEDGKNAGSAKKSVQTAVFENPEFGTVRIVTDEKGEPWFCAKDLCDPWCSVRNWLRQ